MSDAAEVRLEPGLRLRDRDKREDRVVELVERINPQGAAVPPYWRIRNVRTGLVTTVHEHSIPNRFTAVQDPEA